MILLFDGLNLATRCLSPAKENNGVNYDLYEYIVFNSIYSSLLSFPDATEVVIAVDSNSWRKDLWPKYKAHREEDRNKTGFDWGGFFNNAKFYFEELCENFPFKHIKVHGAEADDIIGAICLEYPNQGIIISADSDFLQLSNKAKIYHPLKKDFIHHDNPEYFIEEQILCGQKKDNIYNIMTSLDVETNETKARFGPKTAKKIIEADVSKWVKNNNKKDHYDLNKKLLDFRMIPEDLKDKIIYNYKKSNLSSINESKSYIIKKMSQYNGWRKFFGNFHEVEKVLERLV